MTKVYVLMGECVGDPVVLGVFSSVKKVTEAREWLLENDMYCKVNPKGLYVDVFELNGERIEKKVVRNEKKKFILNYTTKMMFLVC